MYDTAIKKLLGLQDYESLDCLETEKTPTAAQATLILALVISDFKDDMLRISVDIKEELRLIREQLSELRNQLQGYDTNSTIRSNNISGKLEELRAAWLES